MTLTQNKMKQKEKAKGFFFPNNIFVQRGCCTTADTQDYVNGREMKNT